MKFKSLLSNLLIILTLLFFASCSKDVKKLSGKISFSASSLVAGNIPENGLVLNGSNGTNKIQLALTNAADDLEVELEPGQWNFKVIAWNSDGTNSPLHGVTTCGFTSSDLSFGDFTIVIDLNKGNCTDPIFGPSSMKRGDDGTQFKDLVIRPCLYFNNLTFSSPLSETCYDSWKEAALGKSYKVIFFNVNTVTGQRNPGIVSKCIDVNATTDGVTDLHLPLNSPNGSFPFVVNSYEDYGCNDKIEQSYIISTSSEPVSGVANADFVNNDTYSTSTSYLYFPDNFIGHGYSALTNIQPEDPRNCGGVSHCFDNQTGLQSGDNNRFETIKNNIHSIIGGPDGTRGNTSSHASVKVDDGGGNGIIVYKTALGSAGGNGNFVLAVGAFSLNVDDGTNLDITSAVDIATLVTNINSSANYKAIVLEGSNEGATIPAGIYNFSPGQDGNVGNKRDRSVLWNVTQIFGGALGAIFHKNGLTTCSSVISAVGNTFTIVDHKDGGLIDIVVANPVTTMSTNYTSGGSLFEGRIEIHSNSAGDTETQILEFNCTATGNKNQMGLYAAHDLKPGKDSKVEMFYESTPTWTNTKVEIMAYGQENGSTFRNITSFKATATDEFQMWTASQLDDGVNPPHYTRGFHNRNNTGDIEQKTIGLSDLNANMTLEFDANTGLIILTPIAGTQEIAFTERKFNIQPLEEVTGFTLTAVEYPYANGFNTNTSSGHNTLSYNFIIGLENSLLLL